MTGTEQMLIGAVGALALAVVALFGLEQKRHGETASELKDTRRRLEECETMRFKTVERVAKLEAGCAAVDCPLRAPCNAKPA